MNRGIHFRRIAIVGAFAVALAIGMVIGNVAFAPPQQDATVVPFRITDQLKPTLEACDWPKPGTIGRLAKQYTPPYEYPSCYLADWLKSGDICYWPDPDPFLLDMQLHEDYCNFDHKNADTSS